MPKSPSPPQLERVAHRGSPKLRRENTIPSFALALKHGADAIELDVHLTADRVVVVHHDENLRRHGHIEAGKISAIDWADLAALDPAIPRLSDVLEMVEDRAVVYVELKGEHVEQAALDVASGFGRRFAVHSFDHVAVERAAKLAPDVPRGVLLDRGTPRATDAMESALSRTKARDVWPHWSLVDATLVRKAHELDARVVVWTVDDTTEASRLVALGVDAICTDDVRILANLQ